MRSTCLLHRKPSTSTYRCLGRNGGFIIQNSSRPVMVMACHTCGPQQHNCCDLNHSSNLFDPTGRFDHLKHESRTTANSQRQNAENGLFSNSLRFMRRRRLPACLPARARVGSMSLPPPPLLFAVVPVEYQ